MISAGQIISAAGASVLMVQLWANPGAALAEPLQKLEDVGLWASGLHASSSRVGQPSVLDARSYVQSITASSSDNVTNAAELTYSLKGLATAEGYRPSGEVRLVDDKDVRQVRSFMGPEWAGLAETVRSWSSLGADWDGEDGVAPSAAVISAAVAFAHRAGYGGTPKPSLYIAGDGEVGFRWSEGDDFASVAFLNDGNVVVYCTQGGEQKPLKIDAPVDDDPDFTLLLKRLKRFADAQI